MDSPIFPPSLNSMAELREEKERGVTSQAMAVSYDNDPEKRSACDSEPESEDMAEVVRKAEDVAIMVSREHLYFSHLKTC